MLTISQKRSIVDVQLGSKYTSRFNSEKLKNLVCQNLVDEESEIDYIGTRIISKYRKVSTWLVV